MGDKSKSEDDNLEEVEIKIPDLTEQEIAQDSEGQRAKDALEAAQLESKKHWELALRTQAELENTKKRAQKDIENAHKFGMEQLVKALIPVVDSLEQGLSIKKGEDPHANAIHEGMELTLKMLLDTLKRFGVDVLEPLGQPFDPARHEAMLVQPSPDVAPHHVLQVIQKGYLLQGRLIRPARVIVAKAVE